MQTITIQRIAQGGDGIGHLEDGRVCFVPGGLPGDVVEILIEKEKKSWARARIERVIEGGPGRIEPDCQHFLICGGCAFRHATYETEFAAKVGAARDTLERIGKLDLPEGEEIPSDPVDGYRIRARLHAEHGKLGYYAAGTHDVFDLRECPVLHPTLANALPYIKRELGRQSGELEIEAADDEHVLVSFKTRDDAPDLAQRLAELERVRGARVTIRGNMEEWGDFRVPAEHALDLDIDETVPGGRFRQSNGPMTSTLRDLVDRRLPDGPALVELFCGTGNFTFHVADAYASVIAYEFDPEAVITANELAAALDKPSVRFSTMDLDEEVPGFPEDCVVLLDPPRTGAKRVAEELTNGRAAAIVYVSCDGATLARDARILSEGGYELTSLDFVDMFPRTVHLEAVARFDRTSAL